MPGPESAPRGATALNPEAGDHPVPQDPLEIDAAVQAGLRTLAVFPYFEARYGERGRRFTSSDSAWLAALATQPPPVVSEQVFWLGEVLANRGMPRLTLEVHLGLLHEELVRAVPSRATSYTALQAATRALFHARCAVLDEARFEALAREFEDAVAPAPLANMGRLLVSAVADEGAGIDLAVPSLLEWAADDARFSPRWVTAVRDTVTRARAARRA